MKGEIDNCVGEIVRFHLYDTNNEKEDGRDLISLAVGVFSYDFRNGEYVFRIGETRFFVHSSQIRRIYATFERINLVRK